MDNPRYGRGKQPGRGKPGSMLKGDFHMDKHGYSGLDFIEGFSLLAGALWLIGALLVGGMVMLGADRAAQTVIPKTPVASMPETL